MTFAGTQTTSLASWKRLALAALRTEVIWTDQAHALSQHPSIVICNHASLIDGVLIALASPIPMAFAVTPAYAIHNRPARAGLAFLSKCGLGRVIPVSQDRPSALRALYNALRAGESVMIFPSGTISVSTDKPGYLWLHEKTGAPIIRASIEGADKTRLFSRTGADLWPRIRVTI